MGLQSWQKGKGVEGKIKCVMTFLFWKTNPEVLCVTPELTDLILTAPSVARTVQRTDNLNSQVNIPFNFVLKSPVDYFKVYILV